MPIFNNALAGASGGAGAGYAIERSLRFNSGDSSYLSKTFAAGNRKTWTWSGWVKRSKITTLGGMFFNDQGGNNNTYGGIFFHTDGSFGYNGYSTQYRRTAALYRDLSAWMHCVVACDTTSSTAQHRMRIYVNGAEITDWTANSTISQNYDLAINNASEHRIGRVTGDYLNGYLADVHFIDGQALAPTDFGETDDNGVWQPKEFDGTYGPLVNQSQTWSANATGAARPASNAFDGSFSSSTAGSSLSISFTGITVSSLRLWADGPNNSMSVTINGSAVNVPLTNSAGTWVTVPLSGASTFSSIQCTSSSPALYAVEADGKLLINSGVSVADNSFHLDFKDNSSNAALGTDTSGNSNNFTVNNLIANRESVSTDTIASVSADPAVLYQSGGNWQSGYNTANEYVANNSSSNWVFQNNGLFINVQKSKFSQIIVTKESGDTAEHYYSDDGNNFNSMGNLTAFTITSAFGHDYYMVRSLQNGGSQGSGIGIEATSIASELTLSTSNNFNSLAVGDVVQAAGSYNRYISSSITPSSPPSIGSITNSGSQVFDVSPTDTGGKFLVAELATAADSLILRYFENFTLTTNPTTYGPSYVSDNGTSWTQVDASFVTGLGYSISNGSPHKYFAVASVAYNSAYVMSNNSSGNYWTFSDGVGTPKITAINASGPTVTVNGGKWYGANGSGTSGGSTVISTTAVTNGDNLVDSPTNGTQTDTGAGGEVVGCYSTLNPLSSKNVTLSNGNLDASITTSDPRSAVSTVSVSSGKWYAEVTYSSGNGDMMVGVVTDQYSPVSGTTRAHAVSSDGGSVAYFGMNGDLRVDHVNSSYGATYTTGDVIGIALNLDNDEITFYKNGASQGAVTSKSFTGGYTFFVSNGGGNATQGASLNFGQRAFAFSAPTNFKSINTANLPTPTIADGSKYFDTKLYTSTGADLAVTGLQFSPSFVWVKNRQTANHHGLFDIVRGPNKFLQSNRSNAESTTSGSGYGTGTFNSFDANGFTVGSDVGANVTNYPSGQPHVAWAWDAGTSTVSNTDGTITSQVRANPSAGFSIVSYTNGGGTVGHGLSAPPEFIITKRRDATYTWSVYSKPTTKDAYLALNLTSASGAVAGMWGSAEPTSSVFGTTFYVAPVGSSMIAYCFSSVEGYSSVGSYIGNGSADGPFVFTGFKIAWLMVKRTDAVNSWVLYDSKRNTFNIVNSGLLAEDSRVETDYGIDFDFLSNGFKIRSAGSPENASGGSYLYLAFASNPFASNGGLAR